MTFIQKITISLVQFLRLARTQLLISQTGGLSHCRYSESCGQYLVRKIQESGVALGLFLGFKRIFSCQGWT